jgi:hypothetical protein
MHHSKFKKIALITIMSFAMSACANSKFQDSPVGIGKGLDRLKKSPCACMILPNEGAPLNYSLS